MILYLIRHGIAVDRTDPKSPPESERPLTARGVHKTRSAALGLRALGAKLDVLITSPYVRAAQTAEIFAEALGFPLEKIRVNDSLKPAGNPAEILKEIAHLRAREVACFGHAPHLDLTVAQLAGARSAFTELKKAGVACFEQVSAHGRWELRWILTPKVLRDLSE
ncbi:MAG TPA: phosphohistidine phosphatase SixA [Candidatus Acidoferrales bacterium]|jgi:phosphohistidine phosphatase|nr:phosphohistidine phosphatase SixA [Candidatus Acidoferrales bacterium]